MNTTINVSSGEISAEESANILSQDIYLPIGTVTTLKNHSHKVLIIGVLQTNQDNPEKIYDYSGVNYPIGLTNPEEMLLFDKSQIESVVFLGFWDEDQDELQERIKSALSEQGGN